MKSEPQQISKQAETMRRMRKADPVHARRKWREAYWRRKGFKNYQGVALGLMDTPLEIRQEVEKLRTDISGWNFKYYVWGISEVEDSEFDLAFARLQALEKQYPNLEDPSSPTCRVGSPLITTQSKVPHRFPMLSLDKVKTVKDLVSFFGDYEGVVEPKIDGCSVELRYVNGRLIQAVTRGDGREGEDVTPHVRTIRTVPLRLLERKLTINVRGEVFMQWSSFNRYNERLIAEQDQPVANPRNATSGALGLKHPEDAAKVPMSFIAYQVVGRAEGLEASLYSEVLSELEQLGFVTTSTLPKPVKECMGMYQSGFHLNDAEAVSELVTNLETARRLQDFPTDGLVFKVDDLKVQQELGYGTTAPKWALAFKYPPDQVKTRVTKIEWTVGKTGKITPVAEFEPVLISGSVVAKASLCNANEIKRLGVNVGDEVLIEKSNEIIPKVMKVVARHSQRSAEAPAQCPVCRSEVKRYKEYVDVFCTNTQCPAQAEARLVYAVSKNALDIDGCGPQMVATFIANGAATLPAMLSSDCAFLKGAAKKKAQAGLAKALTVPFWRKLSACCVDGWGKEMCMRAASRFPTLPLLLDAREKKPGAERCPLAETVGDVNNMEFGIYVRSHREEFEALISMGFFPEEADVTKGTLDGKSFCITGSIPGCERSIAEEEIRKRGGVVKTGVSRKLDFLVVGNEPGNNKLDGARRWGTATLSYEQLFAMLDWNPSVAVPSDAEA